MTTESARDEALRLAREAGFTFGIVAGPAGQAVCTEDELMRLIALARVGWTRSDDFCLRSPTRMHLWYGIESGCHYCGISPSKEAQAMLAATPKPERSHD